MKLLEAIKKAANQDRCRYATVGKGYYFYFVGWKSPSSGQKFGPFLMAQAGTDSVVEIDRHGYFIASIPCDAPYYFPWFEKENKPQELVISKKNKKTKVSKKKSR